MHESAWTTTIKRMDLLVVDPANNTSHRCDVGQRVRTELVATNIHPQVILTERIVVLSLAEWDTLVSILLEDPTLLSVILNEMLASNRSPATAGYAFIQHLVPHIPARPEPPYLDEEFTALCTSMQAKLL